MFLYIGTPFCMCTIVLNLRINNNLGDYEKKLQMKFVVMQLEWKVVRSSECL